MNRFERFFSPLSMLFILFCINLLLFYKSYNAGFVTDFTGLQEKLETQEFSNFIYSFGYPIVQPLLQFINVVFYKIFHLNPLAWLFYYVGLHSLVSLLLFQFVKSLFERIEHEKSIKIAMLTVVLFLVSSFHPEVLTWRISTAFLWSALWILVSLKFTLKYYQNGRFSYLFGLGLANGAALLTFEWGLIILPLIICMGLFYLINEKENAHKKYIVSSLIVSGLLTTIYFGLNYLSFGSMLAHYGSEVHFNFDLLNIISSFWKYFAKHIFLVHYYPYSYREAAYSFFNNTEFLIASTLSLLVVFLFLIYRYGLSHSSIVHLLLLSLAIISLIPVANLSFEYLFQSENDRYGYIFSIFLSVWLSYLIIQRKKWLWPIVGIWMFFSLFFQQQMMGKWNQNKQVFWGLMDSFESEDADIILALNMPDNLGGTFLFRDFSGGSSFVDGIRYTAAKDINAEFIEVCQYNMLSKNDGVSVNVLNDSMVQVRFNQFGTWFWKRGEPSDYENELYQVQQDEGQYTLTLKNKKKMKLIYQDGTVWKNVKMD